MRARDLRALRRAKQQRNFNPSEPSIPWEAISEEIKRKQEQQGKEQR